MLEVQGKPKRDVKFRVREKRVPAQSSFRMEQINQDDLESPLDDGVYADQETYRSHFAENDRTRTEMEHENVEHNTEGKIEKRITGKIIRGCLELNVEASFESVT